MLPPGYEQSCSFSKEMPGLPLLVFCTTRKAVSFLPPTPHSASSPRSPFINSLSSTLIPACGAHSPPPLAFHTICCLLFSYLRPWMSLRPSAFSSIPD